MQRLRLYDFRNSDAPKDMGLCQGDIPSIARAVNSAQRRLVMAREAGDEGWWGSWAEMAFTVTCENPFITTPRHVARVEKFDVCNRPITLNNQFGEYLNFGNGRMPQFWRGSLGLMQSYTRNNVPFFTDFVGNKTIRVYTSNSADNDLARVLVQGTDQYGNRVRTVDNQSLVDGEFVVVTDPFNTTTNVFSVITGFQKDVTVGVIRIFMVDQTTGEETELVSMEPSETTASYRRYYFTNVPRNCCLSNDSAGTTVTVTALVKLDLIPVAVDTDYLLIQNIEALAEECQSLRYSKVDSKSAKEMAAERHLQAIRLLQGELVHYMGKTDPQINFAPFGSARLPRRKIGTLI